MTQPQKPRSRGAACIARGRREKGLAQPAHRYGPTIAQHICDRLAHGESIRAICADQAMPCWTTVRRWLMRRPEFRAAYARAREDQADWLAAEALDRARGIEADNAAVVRVLLAELHWQAARLKPKVYGERADPGQGGASVDLAATLRQALARARQPAAPAGAPAAVPPADDKTQADAATREGPEDAAE